MRGGGGGGKEGGSGGVGVGRGAGSHKGNRSVSLLPNSVNFPVQMGLTWRLPRAVRIAGGAGGSGRWGKKGAGMRDLCSFCRKRRKKRRLGGGSAGGMVDVSIPALSPYTHTHTHTHTHTRSLYPGSLGAATARITQACFRGSQPRNLQNSVTNSYTGKVISEATSHRAPFLSSSRRSS